MLWFMRLLMLLGIVLILILLFGCNDPKYVNEGFPVFAPKRGETKADKALREENETYRPATRPAVERCGCCQCGKSK